MSRYDELIKKVFHDNYSEGDTVVLFSRAEFDAAAVALGIERIKNLGDIVYSYRFRSELPQSIKETAPVNTEWIIVGAGSGRYEFKLASPAKIMPSMNRARIKIPDATPEVVKQYAPGTDEQALLTKVRYNRLVDLALGLTCYSIQNHLRTTVKGIGQIEIDEIYIGLNQKGAHFVIPCQAKSPGDRFGIVQVMQDIEFCRIAYPHAICRPVALQFLGPKELAILELSVESLATGFRLSVVEERHYQLVNQNEISCEEILRYGQTC